MDGSRSLLIRSDSSLALRCRKGAIHPIIRSPRRRGRAASRRLLLLRLVEISQIRRRLILLRGHQVAIGAQEIILLADDHMMVVLGTNRLAPDRVFFCIAKVLVGDGART